MCKAKTPKYRAPPRPAEYAREKEPDQSGLFNEARFRAQQRGGGARRGTLLSGLTGPMGGFSLAQQTGGGARGTVLGRLGTRPAPTALG